MSRERIGADVDSCATRLAHLVATGRRSVDNPPPQKLEEGFVIYTIQGCSIRNNRFRRKSVVQVLHACLTGLNSVKRPVLVQGNVGSKDFQHSNRLGSGVSRTLQKSCSSAADPAWRTERAELSRYSLPQESSKQKLQPLNFEYPSLADFEILRTIGIDASHSRLCQPFWASASAVAYVPVLALLQTSRRIGTFARVKLVRHRTTGAYRALKSIKKIQVLRLKQLQHVLNEKSILARANHPFIVQLHSAYQDNDRLHMLIDYIPGGELFKHLRNQPNGRFSPPVARFYSACIVLALEYLHANNIIYRDLKPENLLLDKDGYLKMTDFGFAKEINDSVGRTWTMCGTPQYLAPEVILNRGYDKAVDWWSVGALLFEMLTGKPPFHAQQRHDIYSLIATADYTAPAFLDADAKDLIQRLLNPDTAHRLGNLKGGAQDIKRHPFFAATSWKELLTGKAEPAIRPIVLHDGDESNYELHQESIDDPSSPMLDLAVAHRIFRGF